MRRHESLERMTWSLVAALGDEHGEDLLHLLTCAECRAAAAAVLRAGDGLASALVPDYDPLLAIPRIRRNLNLEVGTIIPRGARRGGGAGEGELGVCSTELGEKRKPRVATGVFE